LEISHFHDKFSSFSSKIANFGKNILSKLNGMKFLPAHKTTGFQNFDFEMIQEEYGFIVANDKTAAVRL
jgi:hypothetical protein